MENRLPTSDQNFVESLIPQRSPFVMVNEIAEYSESHLISGFEIKEDNIFVQNGIFQASGMIEHQAQSVALHTGYKYYLLGKDAPTGYIGAIKSFEAEALPKVGDHLKSEVTILNEVMGVTLVNIITKLNDVEIANSQMKTVVK
ncbi:FabZ [Chryseobacterium sp. ERMR1:04]|uniref:FabZ n=1 Tax=Chryseobacterium sp. ERMR1:04 TaxID=1705393 RepID=UPI0006C8C596|nr:FabZ [Chryseobacterium sp. ERMR1:04]KPH12127.1 FabZ [Chryseobacterium sp. ERMR1:04]